MSVLPGMGVPDDITRIIMETVGQVWNRPVLTHRDRSLITIGALAALGRDEPLLVHIKGALDNGMTVGEVYEAILRGGLYAGLGVPGNPLPKVKRGPGHYGSAG